uniref:Apoptosis facilitator Bcl-2-like protein 14 n=1 Tax=Leptobrachium leishanense TaxID=445787 RepID=A0A8C5PKD1_9ANUR
MFWFCSPMYPTCPEIVFPAPPHIELLPSTDPILADEPSPRPGSATIVFRQVQLLSFVTSVMVSVQESTMDDIPLQDENGIEFRLLMAYAQRSRSASIFQHINEAATVEGVSEMEGTIPADHKAQKPSKTRTKKSKWPKLLTPMCLRPVSGKKKKKSLKVNDAGPEDAVVTKLQKIVRQHSEFDGLITSFRGLPRTLSLETDSQGDEELIREIVKILQDCGDRVNEEMKKNNSLLARFRNALSYEFFSTLTNTFLTQSVPCSGQEAVLQKTKVALCFDVATKLTTLDNQPMNRVLGFGAQYIKDHYTPWIQRHGGWEKALNTESEEEEIE